MLQKLKRNQQVFCFFLNKFMRSLWSLRVTLQIMKCTYKFIHVKNLDKKCDQKVMNEQAIGSKSGLVPLIRRQNVLNPLYFYFICHIWTHLTEICA